MGTTAVTEVEEEPPATPHHRIGVREPVGLVGRMSGALRRRAFRWWFAGQVTSSSGAMTQAVALSWTVLQLTHSAVWLSAVTACSFAPSLVLGPWAGALVDRADRRRLLIGTQALMMVIAGALFGLSVAGQLRLPLILGLSLLTGAVASVDSPARQVYVVDLVGRNAVASAVGLWEVALNASRVVGPGLGGLLLATSGASACFGVNALTYLAPLCVLVRMQATGHVSAARRGAQKGAAREGLRYALRTPLFRALLPMSAASGLIFSMGVALPPLVSSALHLGGGGYGAMMACFGVGGLPGALLAAAAPEPTGRRVRVLALLTAVSVLIVAWAPVAAVAMAGMVLAGMSSIWFIALANTLAQVRCDPDFRGRVMSLWGMAMTGTLPLTSFIVGAVIDGAGARVGFSISGICVAAAALAGWRALRD
ncbi:MFS transporter [Actinospica sp.]|uniref:MFS transporter n=1 Tax=Actinospica sp. TaxID=1872142 RepID=UPI002CA006DE|nr:MFS transporter [Actinospica sp.]HWG22579.1 MFS transporter [Actinospica sp.]